MLGTALTITLDGSGGTAKVLPLINQDGYSSEYYLDDGLVTYRAKVRHSRDNVKAGSQPFDRHTVTFSRYVKPTEANVLGRFQKSRILFGWIRMVRFPTSLMSPKPWPSIWSRLGGSRPS